MCRPRGVVPSPSPQLSTAIITHSSSDIFVPSIVKMFSEQTAHYLVGGWWSCRHARTALRSPSSARRRQKYIAVVSHTQFPLSINHKINVQQCVDETLIMANRESLKLPSGKKLKGAHIALECILLDALVLFAAVVAPSTLDGGP